MAVMKFSCFLTLSLLLAGLSSPLLAANILSVFPHPGPSQYVCGSALLKALAERGHIVTSVSVFPQEKPLKNFRDVVIFENANLYGDFLAFTAHTETIIRNVFENKKFKALLRNKHFDLVIVEVFESEALLGLGEHFRAPVIAVSTFGTASFIDYLVGNPSPLSYIPHISMDVDNDMSLRQRFQNMFATALDAVAFNSLLLPIQERLYRKNFPSNKLSLNEARKNVALVLINNHFALSFPRPLVSNMIEVGGLHITQKPQPLPQDLQELLDKAYEGAIYFSLGSNLKRENMPQKIINDILQTFRELRLLVLWKFEAEELPNKPDNVYIQPWLPQHSILAHCNIKLFISHGGHLSTIEAIHFGKPILGLSMFIDQITNIRRAVRAGYALRLDLNKITKNSFKCSIIEIWSNPKYTEKILKLSKQFRDQPMTPMERAIYWVEYVVRHQGALHLRNPGQNLNFWQYYNIDVFVIIAAAIMMILVILIALCRCCRNPGAQAISIKKKRK